MKRANLIGSGNKTSVVTQLDQIAGCVVLCDDKDAFAAVISRSER